MEVRWKRDEYVKGRQKRSGVRKQSHVKDKSKLILMCPFTHQAQQLTLSCEVKNHLYPNIYKKIFTMFNNLTNVWELTLKKLQNTIHLLLFLNLFYWAWSPLVLPVKFCVFTGAFRTNSTKQTQTKSNKNPLQFRLERVEQELRMESPWDCSREGSSKCVQGDVWSSRI